MMHFFKQVLCGFLFFVSIVVLAGCGSSGSSPSTTSGDGTDITSASFTGTGNKVTAAFTSSGGNIKFILDHEGESNFIVWLWSEREGREALLVNETGNVKNSETIEQLDSGNYFFEVQADGLWSILVEGESLSESPDAEPSYAITAELLDEDGEATRTISEGNPGTVKVTVKNLTGAFAVYQFVTVTTSKGSFLNSDGTAITNSSGVAEFSLIAGGATGAGTIDVAVGNSNLETPFAFQIGEPDSVKLGSFVDGSFQEGVLLSSIASGEKLSIGGTAIITAALAVLDGDNYIPYISPVEISFSTLCPTAVVDPAVSTRNGIATTTYRGDGCTSGSDKVTATASIAGATLSASADLLLAEPEVGSISFVSAEPQHMALAETSNSQFPELSVITFIVRDEVGNVVPNELVNFELSTEVGGISLSPSSAETNSEGKVIVTVNSGSIPTSVRVHATVNDSQIATVSSILVISTGLADQNSFSVAIEKFTPEGWNIQGTEVAVTVRAADHFNNPVPDGTSIYFTTEGGAIEPTCSTLNGSCSVVWRSQEPRPADGRVTILATALGEESFIDANGSGRYESTPVNPGEDPDIHSEEDDMDEAFLDKDYDGIRDPDEEFVDYNKDGLFTEGNGMYNGTLCVEGCSNELIHVRNSIVLSMSSSFANVEVKADNILVNEGDPIKLKANGPVEVNLTVADINGNSMPAGTTIDLTAPGNAEIEGETSFEVPDSSSMEPWSKTFLLKVTNTDENSEGQLQIEVTSPGGTVTPRTIKCSYTK
ncbi:MAG: hypothetical protein GY737_04410 [Desulfobacteraceae bacterium]|nr:hypothetical protein [Desulfobacteraceae bacterium]